MRVMKYLGVSFPTRRSRISNTFLRVTVYFELACLDSTQSPQWTRLHIQCGGLLDESLPEVEGTIYDCDGFLTQ